MRGHYLSDRNRVRVRRTMSLRHRPTSHPSRHEDRGQGFSAGSNPRSELSRSGHLLNSVRPDNLEQTILVDDVSFMDKLSK